jgi:CRISPR-associated protein Cas2
MTCVVAYDIEENRPRSRLARFLEKKGKRLQKSVFVVEVERHSFKGFASRMQKLAEPGAKIAIFRLCAGCKANAVQLTEAPEVTFYAF